MFSGIIEDLGVIRQIRPRGDGRTLVVQTGLTVAPAGQAGVGTADRERVGLGDSVAIMGACLTVEAVHPPDRFEVAAGRETIERTTLGQLGVGASVHLERALRVGDRLDGHLVSGHVDGTGTVISCRQEHESVVLWVSVEPALARYVAVKGSVAVDGVSLTVNELGRDDRSFRVNLIPFTGDHTQLARLHDGQRVNIEVDQVARYVERLIGGSTPSGLTAERMRALGFGR